MSVLNDLEPKRVFFYFEEICQIPHGSGNTKEISNYLTRFARKHKLFHIQDDYNNVLIKKEGSPGYEDSPPVLLQGHMDMVCEKTRESSHDFMKDGLKLFVDGDDIRAKDTTLGGDDGIALAYCLAILEDDSLVHPPLEVVFTVDEEVGLLGAQTLDYSELSARTMINLDSEEEGCFYISCAGGMTATSHLPVRRMEAEGVLCTVAVSGLMGGHSGAEIHRGGANASILLSRLLLFLKERLDFLLVDLQGGTKETAITQTAYCKLLIDGHDCESMKQLIDRVQQDFQAEYAGIEEQLQVTASFHEKVSAQAVHPVDAEKLIFFLTNLPGGVIKMSGVIPGLVETSNNLGLLVLTNNQLVASCAPRSSLESARDYTAAKIQYLTEFLGGDYHQSGLYPAWEYQPDSRLQKVMTEVYEEMFGEKPQILALHAGLECGIFYKKLPGLDCVSMGPDIRDIHTVKERLSISSVKRNYSYLLKVLEALK